jgi:hypothetical protein
MESNDGVDIFRDWISRIRGAAQLPPVERSDTVGQTFRIRLDPVVSPHSTGGCDFGSPGFQMADRNLTRES